MNSWGKCYVLVIGVIVNVNGAGNGDFHMKNSNAFPQKKLWLTGMGRAGGKRN